MKAYRKQMDEWAQEDNRLFHDAFKNNKGFNGTMLRKKRGHRNKPFKRENCVEITFHEARVKNDRRYDGIVKGRKGENPVSGYK